METSDEHINLMRGWPSPDVLPATLLSNACQRVLLNPAEYTPILQYAPSAGHPALRQELSRLLASFYDVDPDTDRICVTGGASQSLACILQSFTDPNYTKAVWVIAPCYYLACGVFEDAGFAGRLRASPEDDEGVDLEALELKIQRLEQEDGDDGRAKPKPFKNPGLSRKLYKYVIYAVPTCSNPSGKTLSLARRQGLVKIARKYDALIVCDDVYDFLQWPLDTAVEPQRPPEMRLPRLCDIDRAMGFAEEDPGRFGYAVSNGSFSKIAGPGVRTGWVEASSNFVIGLGDTGSTLSGGAPSQLCAAMLGEMLRNGELIKHIEDNVRPSLQRRHKLAMDAIRAKLLPLGYRTRETSLLGARIYGGYFIWLTPEDHITLSSKVIADAAVAEENLAIGYGNMFEVHGDEKSAEFTRDIRVCFAWESEQHLVEGIVRLGKLLKRMLEAPEEYETPTIASKLSGFVDCYK